MTVLQCIVTYSVCWFLVLFMVLPHRAEPPAQPGLGHAPSAPADPQIKRKMKWTTMLAIIPTLALFFIVSAAHAEDSIYHAGSHEGCTPRHSTYQAPADLNARDGYGTGGNKVAPATLGGKSQVVNTDHIDIPLEIPTEKYLEPQGGTPSHNVDMSQSFGRMGTIGIDGDGSATLNGKAIAPSADDCQ